MSEAGHNSGETVAAGHLRAFVERIERLDEDHRAIMDERKDVYAEAKGTGFDVKALKAVVALRRQDAAARAEFETTLELYKSALGMA